MNHIVPGCDVTGRSRHLLTNVAYTNRKRRPGSEPEAALEEETACGLLGDLVRPLPGGVLRRLDLLAALAA
jgi:hypothetical protein